MSDDPEPSATDDPEPDPQPTANEPEPEPEPEPKPTETVDFWKKQARENERRAKANAKAAEELEQLKASQMSETEKAVAEAETRGRQAALGDIGQRLAAAEIKAALTGVVPNPAEIVEDLNLGKYVTDDGDVDEDAVKTLRTKYEALAPAKEPAKPPAGQRPKPNLQTVPVGSNGAPQMTDMNELMRRRASSE